MPGLRLAISLLRIPRLFISLLAFPLVLSCILITVQLYTTGLLVSWTLQDPEKLEERVEYFQDNNIARHLIYGSGEKRSTIKVCRWVEYRSEKGLHEIPPSKECQPDLIDVAIHVENPETFEVSEYEQLFDGNFERLHICRSECKPHTIIRPESEEGIAELHSIPALMLLNASKLDQALGKEYMVLAKSRHDALSQIGKTFLHADGYEDPIQISHISFEVALIFSVASIIIVGLWLAVKAHRKVLDYFARSGALLPMVATLGKKEFYSAIWLVTLFRVGAFLLASIPTTYIVFSNVSEQADYGGIFQKDIGHIILWITTLTVSFSLAALIASVADLKHRRNLFATAYRYLPLILSIIGSLIWLFSFLLQDIGRPIRDIITCLPIVSMGPIIVTPLFQPHLNILVINCLLSTYFIVTLAQSNSRWFAAHLEEI